MAIHTVDLKTTSAEALVKLMEQRLEFLVMQGDRPLAKVVPVAAEHDKAELVDGITLTLEDEIARAVSGDLLQTPVDDIDEDALMREILDYMRGDDSLLDV